MSCFVFPVETHISSSDQETQDKSCSETGGYLPFQSCMNIADEGDTVCAMCVGRLFCTVCCMNMSIW